jgi:hypothetical protein
MSRSFFCLVAVALVLSLAPGCGGGGGAAPPQDPGTPNPPPPTPDEPTVTAVAPPVGSVDGGTLITVMGSGFADDDPGTNTVTIGGAQATGVAVLDDGNLTCTTPPGTAGMVDVVVTNDNGTGTLVDGFRYFDSVLYAADGKGGVPGNLYRIDPATGNATTIGTIGFAVTGLAVAPDGTLYGVEATQNGGTGSARLLTIDRTTGAGTVVGLLQDASDMSVHNDIADVTFALTELIGAKGTGMSGASDAVNIDTSSGEVTQLLGGGTTSIGNGIASDENGNTFLAPFGTSVALVILDPGSGTGSPGPALSGGTNMVINAMTFHEGVLYANDAQTSGTGTASLLVTIDPNTGVITPVGALPNGVDALASTLP